MRLYSVTPILPIADTSCESVSISTSVSFPSANDNLMSTTNFTIALPKTNTRAMLDIKIARTQRIMLSVSIMDNRSYNI